jgi:1,6-anhydro-N-acetylmuramate kinase
MQQLDELDAADVQRALVEFSALSVAAALERFCRDVDGTENYGLHPDRVEATAFAWLAKQTLENRPGNLPAVTGAGRPVVPGAIYPA